MDAGLRLLTWLAIALLLYVVGSIVASIVRPLQTAGQVTIGMSRDEAIRAIGQAPMQELKEFPACRGARRNWTGNCDLLLASGSKVLLVWMYGVDTVLVVGLGANGKVAFSGLGDT